MIRYNRIAIILGCSSSVGEDKMIEDAADRFARIVGDEHSPSIPQVESVLQSVADGLLSPPGGLIAPVVGGVKVMVE